MTDHTFERISAGLAVAGAVALVALMGILQITGPPDFSAPPRLLVAGLALQAVMVPAVVIGVGLGGLVLVRQGQQAGRLALIGVIGGASYLFILSLLMLFVTSV